MNAFLFVVILVALVALYLAMAIDSDVPVMAACVLLVGVALLAFLMWFVLYGPTPDYLPAYGSDPREIPAQMRD